MSEPEEENEKIRGGPFTWYIIYFAGTGLYFTVYYILIEYINIGKLLALIMFAVLPAYIMYINQFYVFYTEEFDPEKTPMETEHYKEDE